MEFRGNVHPECPNAGNAFHECNYKCFERIGSGEVKKERKFFGFGKKTPIRSTPPASPVRNIPIRSTPPASPVKNTPIRSTPPASPIKNTPIRSTPPASPARVSGDRSPFSSYHPSSSSDENTSNIQRHKSPARIQPFQQSPLSGNNTPDRHSAETSGDRTPRSRIAERRAPTPYYYSEKYEESDDFPAFASSDETSGYVWKEPSPPHGRPVQTKPAIYFDQGEITRTPDHQTPKDLGKVKEPRSRPMTPEHRSRTPEHRSRTPEHQSRTPERRSRTPEPTSRILDPRSQPQSRSPEPYSLISNPRSRTPEPQPTTLEFQSESPQLRTRTPGPRSRTPEPHPRTTLAFQPSSPEPRFKNPESRPRTPERRPTTPNSPRPKTPNSPQLYFTSETKAESLYSEDDDEESVLLFPELLLSPDPRPVSRPTTPDRRRVDTTNKQEPQRKAVSENSDDFSYGEERSVYLYPEIALSSETKLRSASSTPVHYKFGAPTEQEDYVKHYDPPELSDESQSFSLSEIAKMRGMKTFDKEEFQSMISESCVSVGIYKVRASVSSTLQSILDKYGDIASGSKLQSLTTRSYYLESLSSVVLELKSTHLKNLTEPRVQEMLALVRDMESVKIEVGWLRLILTDLLEAVKHLNRHETSIIEKETCDRDLERGKMEMVEKMKELSLKEKEIKECRQKLTEIGGRLGHLEMQSSRLKNSLIFLKSKVEKFQGKSVLGQVL